jgi:signal transduction histidine kinase
LNRSAVSRGAAFEQLDLDSEQRDSAFGTGLRRADLAVIALACAAASAAAAIVATGGVVGDSTAFAAVLVANIATLAVGGLAWRRGRPSSLFGYLLLAEGLLVFVSSLSGSPDSVLHLIGVLGIWASAFGATWLLLVFPGSRPGAAGWIVMGIAFATFLVGELPLILTSPRLEGLTTIASCGAPCPANPALAVHAPNVADAFRNVEGVLQATWGVGLLVYLATRFAWASHARRRVILPVFVSAAPLAAAFTLNAAAFGLAGIQSSGTARAIFAGTRILYPLGFVAGLLLARAYAGEALAFMTRRLVGRPSVATVEQLVRRVLDDPQARLVFWLPRSEQFVDRHGVHVVLDPARETVTWRAFGHGDARVLAVVHDAVLSEDPELVEAVGAASLLALENRRLEHDLLDSVDALRASQRRLVGAASAERRKIERDLHDGVQQKLVALRIQLELVRDPRSRERALEQARWARGLTSTMRSTISARPRTASILRCSPTRGSRRLSARSPDAPPCRSPSISRTSGDSPRIVRPPSTTAASRPSRTSRSTRETTPRPCSASGGTGTQCASPSATTASASSRARPTAEQG